MHRRAVVLLLLAALLPLGVFALVASIRAMEAQNDALEARLAARAGAMRAALDAELGTYLGALRALASSELLDDPSRVGAFQRQAGAVVAALGGWVAVIGDGPEHPLLADTLGRPDLPPPVLGPAEDALGSAFRRAFGEGLPALSGLFTGPVHRRPMLAVLLPLDRPGMPRRVIALGFEPAALQALLARQPLAEGGFVALADAAGRVLATVSPDGAATLPAIAAALEAARTGTPVHAAGQHVLAIEHPAQAPGWTLLLGEPRPQRPGSAWRALRWVVAGSLLFGLGMALAVAVMRREAQREASALHAGRAQVERLHGGLPAIIFLSEVGPGGTARRLYLSGDVRAVTGWDAAAFEAEEAAREQDQAGQQWARDFCREVLRLGTATAERQLARPDGSRATIETTARVLEALPGGHALVVGYMLDVSSRREAERRAMVAERLASLGEMAAGFAHEVKQPLLAMSLAAELAGMALDRTDMAETRRLLDGIVERAQRTSEMIDRLRRFARGSGEKAATEDVRLAAPIEGSLALLQAPLAEAGIAVDLALGDPVPVVRGQAMLLEQVLTNLVANARDQMAGRPKDRPRRIRIAAVHRADGMVALSVGDTGGGIAPEVLDRLFEPFVTTKGMASGTGLGLSICRGLIGAMGGSIEARNEGEGAVFTILLQASAAPPANQDSAAGIAA